MPKQEPSASLFSLEPAIDRRPLKVTPNTSLIETITIMGKARSSCILPSLNLLLDTAFLTEARGSGVLVIQDAQIFGVFTDADALQVIASGRNLAEMKVAELMRQPVFTLSQSDTVDIFTALSLLRQHQIRHLPIIDAGGQLLGMVTLESIRQALQLDELLRSRQLAEVISTPIVQTSVTTSVLGIAQLMVEHQVNSVVLTAGGTKADIEPVGLVMDRDIIQLQALQVNLSQTQAQTIMQTPLLNCEPTESILAAYWKMQQRRVQQFIVSDECGKILGIVTPTNFLKTLDVALMRRSVEQLQRSIEQFENKKTELLQSSDANIKLEVQQTPAELMEQLQCNRLLTAMALRIRKSLNWDEILNTTVAEVRQFLQTERVIIYRFNLDLSGTVVVESVASGWQPALNSTIQDTCFGKNYAQSYKEGRTLVAEDIYTAGFTQCHIDILALYNIRASLIVPILQKEHLWGLLCAYHCSEPRYWRQFEVDLLQQLATHVAIAIQQSELYQQVQSELTERRRAEEQLLVSLKEKEILLKEVHHRVKNNLQTISSLLRLQSDYIKDEKALASFKDSQNRIRSMALIHEKLYQSKDLFRIDFAEYIRELATNLLRSYSARAQTVTLKIDAQDIWLNIDTAIPCGLIINELVLNSLKHAFRPKNKKPQISIAIHSINSGKFRLTISDNGVGLPKDIDFKDTESLGLQLVCTFTEQLEGTIDLDNSQGTQFIIEFAELQ
ncbi:GAF domain-containing protein [Scytonema sp. UIC 10036]|uniref:histidine kinase dimerization/phosphoacceptor domain -containing protein n=1 Tax=Scytonema sp. UIC 10036 TaxID=2304196 RepID=UPI0012DA110C|nr:histidine kinase dimerization/phosphoacceptor domain -containing protein [Scytonema sp. UIC 10036]MUG93406.1 GAF domain-containing protein [Scytonema sp. UIC 10036]